MQIFMTLGKVRNYKLIYTLYIYIYIHIHKGEVDPVYTMKAYRRSGCIAPLIHNIGTRCRWVVNITPWPLYPRYPLNGRLGESQRRSGRYWTTDNLSLPGFEPRNVQPVSSRYTDYAIPALILSVTQYLKTWQRCETLGLLPTNWTSKLTEQNLHLRDTYQKNKTVGL
jgi:hypothetical protein